MTLMWRTALATLTGCATGGAWRDDCHLQCGDKEAGAPLCSGGAEAWRDHPGNHASWGQSPDLH